MLLCLIPEAVPSLNALFKNTQTEDSIQSNI